MKRLNLVIILLFLSRFATAQVDTAGVQLSEEVKSRLIYTTINDSETNSVFTNSDGTSQIGTGSRSSRVYFKQGLNGTVQRLDKRGGNLRKLLESDPKALAKLDKVYRQRRQYKLMNAAEIVCEIAAVAVGMAFLVKLDDDKAGIGQQVGLGAGTAALLGGFYYCYFFTQGVLTNSNRSIQKAVDLYNQNILEAALKK